MEVFVNPSVPAGAEKMFYLSCSSPWVLQSMVF